jgi:phosphate transport system substrate-binding protein
MPPEDQKARLTRDLFAAAYPDEDVSWIDAQAAETEQRIDQAKQARPSTAAGARVVPDAVINQAAPRKRRGTRVAAAVALAVVIIVAAVLGITERHWVAEAAISPVGIGSLLVAAGLAGTATIVSFVRSRRQRILSARVRIDTGFDVDLGEAVWLQGPRHAVADAGVVVVRVKNTGGAPIEPDDYISPLAFHFPGRRVISVDATEFEPPELRRVINHLPGFAIEGDRVKLPMLGLDRDHSFKLVIVLSGTKAGVAHPVVVEGGLRDGRITTRKGVERIKADTLAWGALTALCAGAFAVVLLLNNVTPFAKLPRGVGCVPGSMTVAGSSAFGRAATELAGSYHAYCPGSSIDVRTPGSLEGLRRLAGPTGGPGNLALSDGKVDDPDFAHLVPHRLAIVAFVFVASANVPIDSLSIEDARRIFTGGAHRWSDITGNPRDNHEIRVVGRSSSSGTRRTLERYVLGLPDAPLVQAETTSDSCRDRRPGISAGGPIICERASTEDLTDQIAGQDDAIGYADVSDVEQSSGVKKIRIGGREATLAGIRADYPFWTVEYVYSRGPLEPGSLPLEFQDYLLTSEGRNTMARFQYYACVDELRDLCARR